MFLPRETQRSNKKERKKESSATELSSNLLIKYLFWQWCDQTLCFSSSSIFCKCLKSHHNELIMTIYRIFLMKVKTTADSSRGSQVTGSIKGGKRRTHLCLWVLTLAIRWKLDFLSCVVDILGKGKALWQPASLPTYPRYVNTETLRNWGQKQSLNLSFFLLLKHKLRAPLIGAILVFFSRLPFP